AVHRVWLAVEGMPHRAVAQHLHGPTIRPLDETGVDQLVGVDHAPRREPIGQILYVDHRVLGLSAIWEEAPLGQAPVERHLAALESRAGPAARARLQALVTTTGRLARARGAAAPHALALLDRALGRAQIFESHCDSTSRQKGTAWIIPRMVGVSSCSTVWCMRRSPSAFTVASWVGESPIRLFTSVTLSFFATARLLAVTVYRPPPRTVRIQEPLEAAERVDGRLEHVVRIVGAERLGQDVLDARRLQHGADRAARDDARALRGRAQEHPRRAVVTRDLEGNGRVLEGHEDQILL